MDLKQKFPCKDKYVHYNRRPYISEKGLKIYLPFGKKAYCWFLTDNTKPKCIIYECERMFDKKRNQYYTRFDKPYETFCCFDDVLTIENGTIIYGTLHDNQFFFEKIYYLKGRTYNAKGITDHMKKSKYIIQSYIKNTNFTENVMQFVIPIMNYSRTPILEASNFPYCVYEIVDQNNNSFRMTYIIENIEIENSDCNDVYYMFDKTTVLVNDLKTSTLLREKFSIKTKKKHVDYRSIESCEFEESEDFVPFIESTKKIKEDQESETYRMRCMCIYIPERKKWKPYMKLDNRLNLTHLDKIKRVQNKKYIDNV